MTDFATSLDGTRIAYDRLGDGLPVVVVSGIFCSRPTTQELAELLAESFTVVNYDRRGRGESGDTPPYAVRREVEDIGALIEAVGGRAAVYGHSSGAGLALQAAAAGLPITRLVLHEPPYGGDDEASVASAQALAAGVVEALDDHRPGDAIRLFFADSGMPPEMVEAMATDPGMLAVAPTMPYDLAVMDDADGGTIPEAVARSIRTPTLVVSGTASPAFFQEAAHRLAALIPAATHHPLPAQNHSAPAPTVAPVLIPFLADTP